MIEIEGPDGVIYEFPEGTSDDVIKGAMAKQYSPPAEDRAAQVQGEFDQLPWYKQAAQAADDIVRQVANGATFGYADKFAAYMNGTDVEHERQRSQDAAVRAGWAGTAAELTGGIATGNALMKGGSALLNGAKAVSPAVSAVANAAGKLAAAPGAVGFGARTAGAAAAGAGFGALDAAGHDKDLAEGAAYGAAFGAAGNAIGEGVAKVGGKVAGLFNKQPTVMTQEQLKEAARSAYKASEDAGLILKPDALQRLSKEVQEALVKKGYHPEISPEVRAVLSELDRLGQGNTTLQGVDILRQIAGGARASQNAKTSDLGRDVIEKIDDFLDGISTGDVLMGNKTQGVKALQEARKLWGSLKKSEMIEEAVFKATNNADATGSGGNIDNALRQQFKNILNNPKKRKGFTKDEIAAMHLIVKGTQGQNLMRLVGKMSPQGNGLMQLLQALGALGTGGASIPLAVAGTGAKVLADKATPANIEQLSRIVRSGGDASKITVQPNAAQRFLERNRGGLTLPLTVGGILATD